MWLCITFKYLVIGYVLIKPLDGYISLPGWYCVLVIFKYASLTSSIDSFLFRVV
jgi:hypothetical protein